MAFHPTDEALPIEALPPDGSRHDPRIIRLGHVERMKRDPGQWFHIGVLDNPVQGPPSKDMRNWFAVHDPAWTIEMRVRGNDDGGRDVYALVKRVGDCDECKGLGKHYRAKNQSYDCAVCDGTGWLKGHP